MFIQNNYNYSSYDSAVCSLSSLSSSRKTGSEEVIERSNSQTGNSESEEECYSPTAMDIFLGSDETKSSVLDFNNKQLFGGLMNAQDAKNAQSFQTHPVYLRNSQQNVDLDLHGIWDKSKTSLLSKIGEGTFKEVYLAITETSSKYKQIALALQKPDVESNAVLRELRACQKIAETFSSKDPIVKIYSVALRNGHFRILSKYVNGGDAKTHLPFSDTPSKIGILRDVAEAIRLLHAHGMTHNDLALRNILIEFPKENIEITSLENPLTLIGRQLAKTVFTSQHQAIIPQGVIISPEMIEFLYSQNISSVNVFKSGPPRGVLNDFGNVTHREDSKVLNRIKESLDELTDQTQCQILRDQLINEFPNFHFPSQEELSSKAKFSEFYDGLLWRFSVATAPDCTSPQRYEAVQSYKEAAAKGDFFGKRSAIERLEKATGEQSDAFCLGRLICEVMCHANMINDDAFKRARLERETWLEHFKAGFERDASAINQEDYRLLNLIDPELAELAKNLMSYHPGNCLNLQVVKQKLDQILLNANACASLLLSRD